MVKCKKSMTFEECELMILREKVDTHQHLMNKRQANDETVRRMIRLVEIFLRKKRRICYGGISINALMPKEDEIYNFDVEIPDYDFFSPEAIHDVKELADLFASHGFEEVEAKAGLHLGTYKLYVNFISIADITQIHPEIYKKLKSQSIVRDKIHYCPPNFLRMLLYLELSRPDGHIARWEKVLHRLTLLNKNYPLEFKICNDEKDIMSTTLCKREVYRDIRRYLLEQDIVFFGSFALTKYSHYIREPLRIFTENDHVPNFDVLSVRPKEVVTGLQNMLVKKHNQNCVVKKQHALGELISLHYQVILKSKSEAKDLIIATVYEPLACHSYNVLRLGNQQYMKIATIDTMMSFFLAFLYTNRSYYDTNRILCMAQYLFTIQQKNRLKQTGLLQRFSMNCYGKQKTLIDIRNEKSKKLRELCGQTKSAEYEKWFLRYRPKTRKQKF